MPNKCASFSKELVAAVSLKLINWKVSKGLLVIYLFIYFSWVDLISMLNESSQSTVVKTRNPSRGLRKIYMLYYLIGFCKFSIQILYIYIYWVSSYFFFFWMNFLNILFLTTGSDYLLICFLCSHSLFIINKYFLWIENSSYVNST